MCVNETAPALALMTAATCPLACQKAIGSSERIVDALTVGALRSRVSQRNPTKRFPVPSETSDWSHGRLSALSLILFWMVYPVERPNHNANKTPSRSARAMPIPINNEHPSSSQSERHSASSSPSEPVAQGVTTLHEELRTRPSARESFGDNRRGALQQTAEACRGVGVGRRGARRGCRVRGGAVQRSRPMLKGDRARSESHLPMSDRTRKRTDIIVIPDGFLDQLANCCRQGKKPAEFMVRRLVFPLCLAVASADHVAVSH